MKTLFITLMAYYYCSRSRSSPISDSTGTGSHNSVVVMGMNNRSSSTRIIKHDSGGESLLWGLANHRGEEMPLPSLVLIGDCELLTPCQPCDEGMLSQLATATTANKDDDGINNNEETTNLLQSQLELLKRCQKEYGGIGIAACQVGWRTRIFCMGIDTEDTVARARYPNAPPFPHQFWINPIITPLQTTTTTKTSSSWFWEGCLSVPGMRGWVERPTTIHIQGWNERGEYVEMELDGLAARVAQHECDHLDGILFPDRAVPGTLLPVQAFQEERQERWPKNWPTPGARSTQPGEFSQEK